MPNRPVEVDPPSGDPSEEIERAPLGLATGYRMAGYKVRRRQGHVTLVPVERTFAPKKRARALVVRVCPGDLGLLRKLCMAKRRKR